MIATLNVNLQRCDTPHLCAANGGEHVSVCAARPTVIPCPIPPTFDVTVRIGECDCVTAYTRINAHKQGCLGMPIRVTCSIGGDGTWAGSEVTDVDNPHDPQGRWGAGTGDAWRRIVRQCNDRWALVKALVTGTNAEPGMLSVRAQNEPLFAQRDAVFAALTKARRAEDALIQALGDYEEAMRGEPVGIYGLRRESDGELERYVKRLIEQVGALP